MVRRPLQRRTNPKAHKVEPPPPGTNLQEVARSCRYVGSPYHKRGVTFAGVSRHRPDASLCPQELANKRDRVEAWLRQALEAGHAGGWEKGREYPHKVWYRSQDGVTIYEAREGSPGSGEYHGYPLEPKQDVQGLP